MSGWKVGSSSSPPCGRPTPSLPAASRPRTSSRCNTAPDSNLITAPFPAEYRVDWIRIYDNGFTTLGGIGPQLELQLSRTETDVEISFETQAGMNYDVLYKTNLSESAWSLLQSVAGDGTLMSVYDPISSPAGFYRVESYE